MIFKDEHNTAMEHLSHKHCINYFWKEIIGYVCIRKEEFSPLDRRSDGLPEL